MELYLPSKKILESISFNGDVFEREYRFSAESSEADIQRHIETISYEMMNYYNRKLLDPNKNGKILGNVRGVALEALINARKHGVPPFSYKIIISKNGVCQGFHDEGSFYKREDIKQKLENKIPLKEITPEELEKTSGRGIFYLYLMANSIEVDNKNGVLWTAHLIDK